MAANASHFAATLTSVGRGCRLPGARQVLSRAHRPTRAKSKGHRVFTPHTTHVPARLIVAPTIPQVAGPCGGAVSVGKLDAAATVLELRAIAHHERRAKPPPRWTHEALALVVRPSRTVGSHDRSARKFYRVGGVLTVVSGTVLLCTYSIGPYMHGVPGLACGDSAVGEL